MSNSNQQHFLKAAKDQLAVTWDELAGQHICTCDSKQRPENRMVRESIYYGPRATVDQMAEARALCGADATLLAKLDSLLARRPNDRIMQKFIDYLREPSRHEGRFAVESKANGGITGFRVIKGGIYR